MAELKSAANESEISRDRLAELLNEDLAREYQAIIAYVVYSQVLSGAQYMDIADQLEILYDLDIEAQQFARKRDVRLRRTASLNTRPDFIEALAAVVTDAIASPARPAAGIES